MSSAEVRGSALTVRVTLAGILVGSPDQSFAGVDEETASPRVTFATRELWELLAEDGLVAAGDR